MEVVIQIVSKTVKVEGVHVSTLEVVVCIVTSHTSPSLGKTVSRRT